MVHLAHEMGRFWLAHCLQRFPCSTSSTCRSYLHRTSRHLQHRRRDSVGKAHSTQEIRKIAATTRSNVKYILHAH